jgi:hypothetical protein
MAFQKERRVLQVNLVVPFVFWLKPFVDHPGSIVASTGFPYVSSTTYLND